MSGIASEYGKPPRWERLYKKYFPNHTDGCSRHVKMIAQDLRSSKSPIRKMMIEAGYEPDHLASSMERTVIMLWETRAAADAAKAMRKKDTP